MADLIQNGVIQVGYDGELVTSGIAKNIKDVDRLPVALDKASKQGVKALKSLAGETGETSSAFEKSANRFENSLKRMVAQAQSGARVNVELQKNLAKQFGNENLAAPYIAQINAAMRKNDEFAASAKKTAEIVATEQRYAAERFRDATGGSIAALKSAQQQRIDALKGVDYSPAIKGLASVETAAQKAAFALANGGQSAKQLGFALRNVPAQFSDIVVSLQGGQKPLTIFLQQGAQLKDLFGGAGAAAKALGGYVLGLINPFSLAAVAVAGLAYAYYQGSEQVNAYNKAIITSGNFAGQSIGQLQGLAQSVGAVKGRYSDAREAVVQLAASGIIGSKQLEIATKGVVDGVTLTGGKVQDLVKDFALLAKDPVKGLLQLNEGTNFLTASTYQQVTALEKQGKHQEAVTLAFTAYQSAVSGRSGEIVERLGWIERKWRDIKEASSGALEQAASLGRPKTNAELLVEDRAALKKAQGSPALTFGGNSNFVDTAALERSIAARESREHISAANAKALGIKTQNEQKLLAAQLFTNTESKNASNLNKKDALDTAIKAQREKFAPYIEAYKNDIVKLNAVTKLRDQAIANLQDKPAAPGIREENKLATAYGNIKEKSLDFIRTQQQEIAQQDTVRAGQKLSAELLDFIADKKDKYSKAVLDVIAALAGEVSANDQIIESQKQQKKEQEELTKAKEQYTDALQKSLEASTSLVEREQQNLANIQYQIDVANSSEEAVRALEAAKLLDAAATYEQNIANKVWVESEQETLKWGYAQIELLKERAALINKVVEKSADLEAIKEAQKAQDEFKKRNEKIADDFSKSLTDAIFRGFEGGKSFAKNFKDTLINSFKTLILQPLVRFVVDASGITGVLGSLAGAFSGTANASTGGIGGVQDILKKGFGSLQDAFTGGKGLLDVFSGGNSAIVGSIEKLGVLFANGNGGIADAIGGFLGANAGSISSALPFAGAALQALTGNIKGALFTALGTAIGGPIGGAIGSLLGSVFGGKKKIPRFSSQSVTNYSNGAFSTTSGTPVYKALGATGQTQGLNEAFIGTLAPFLEAFGVNSDLTAKTRVIQKRKASYAEFWGGGISEGVQGSAKTTQKTFEQLIEKVLGSGIARAIGQSALPAGIKKFFDGLVKKEDVAEAINTLVGLKTALVDLPPVFDAIRNAIDTTAYKTSIADLKTRFAAVQTYTGLFYTEQENFDTFTKQLVTQLTALNTPLLSSRDQYRLLVDGIKVVDKASSDQFNGLVALAPAMDTYFKQLEKQKEALDALANTELLRDGSTFATAFAFNQYKGVAGNYGSNFANSYVDGLTQYPLNAPNIGAVNGITFTAPNVGSIGANSGDLITEVRALNQRLEKLVNNSQSENIAIALKAERVMRAVEQLNVDGVILRAKDNANVDVVLKVDVVA